MIFSTINTQSIKSIVFAVFIFITNFCVAENIVRLQLRSGNSAVDETVIYIQPGAGPGFDAEYDAYKLFGTQNTAQIYQLHSQIKIGINGIAPVTDSCFLAIGINIPAQNTYTIEVDPEENLGTGMEVVLIDLHTQERISISENKYIFNSAAGDIEDRFQLLVYNTNSIVTSTNSQTTSATPTTASTPAKGNIDKKNPKLKQHQSGEISISELPFSLNSVKITLGNIQTSAMHVVPGLKKAKDEYSFQTGDLPKGLYFLIVESAGHVLLRERIAVK